MVFSIIRNMCILMRWNAAVLIYILVWKSTVSWRSPCGLHFRECVQNIDMYMYIHSCTHTHAVSSSKSDSSNHRFGLRVVFVCQRAYTRVEIISVAGPTFQWVGMFLACFNRSVLIAASSSRDLMRCFVDAASTGCRPVCVSATMSEQFEQVRMMLPTPGIKKINWYTHSIESPLP